MEWTQTGKGQHVPFGVLPLNLQVVELTEARVVVCAVGDFDGFVYEGLAYADGLDWVRYPAKLQVEGQIDPDYADSAE